ncbi:ATP-binding protein [Halobellus ordinarius]|uniref:ATP-binding protein n=1 Tax=Halobellus ordinarius TaxID=3075120 RepID=UPI002880778D|nr:ATP-binding protein [Halobellus sp. ZY16]
MSITPARQRRVLFVGNAPDFAGLAKRFREETGDRFIIERAASAPEGFAAMSEQPPACIVAEYRLPETDGVDFLRGVREDRPELPFVLYTATGEESIVSEAIAAGATDCFRGRRDAEHPGLLATRIRNVVQTRQDMKETEREGAREHATGTEQYQVLFENTNDAVVWVSYEGDRPYIQEANPRFKALFEPPDEDVVGRPLDAVVAAEERSEEAEGLSRQVRAGKQLDGEIVRETVDGPRTFTWQAIPIEASETENVEEAFAVYTDITQRKERERELQERRERYQSLFENNPLVIWEEDLSETKAAVDAIAAEHGSVEAYLRANPDELDRILETIELIDVNRNAVDYYDAPSKAALMDNLDRIFTDEARETFISLLGAIADGDTRFRSETESQAFTDDRRVELLDCFVPEAHADDYSRAYITGTDITENKQRERELKRERDRLDEFASIVSHDLRNPLNVAAGRVEMAQRECDSEHLLHVEGALDRMNDLIDDLLELARQGEPIGDLEPVALAELGAACWETVETANASLEIDTELKIRANRSRLKQLFENLVRNAVEHGGTDVTITLGGCSDPPGFFIADDGGGIPDTEQETAFGSGFPTSSDGTGFGLPIVAEIATAHGWDVAVTESANGGARFEITDVEVVDSQRG